jgi:hypothetical protein
MPREARTLCLLAAVAEARAELSRAKDLYHKVLLYCFTVLLLLHMLLCVTSSSPEIFSIQIHKLNRKTSALLLLYCCFTELTCAKDLFRTASCCFAALLLVYCFFRALLLLYCCFTY